MKRLNKMILTVLTVSAVMCFSIGACAATKSSDSAQSQAEQTEESKKEDQSDTASASSDQQNDTAYQDALDAYQKAKEESRVSELEEELKQMVKDGKLTQEQADLLLKQAKDQQSLSQGVCPNCGYEFGSQFGGRGNGRGRKGGRGSLGMSGPGSMTSESAGQLPGSEQTGGSAFFDEAAPSLMHHITAGTI